MNKNLREGLFSSQYKIINKILSYICTWSQFTYNGNLLRPLISSRPHQSAARSRRRRFRTLCFSVYPVSHANFASVFHKLPFCSVAFRRLLIAEFISIKWMFTGLLITVDGVGGDFKPLRSTTTSKFVIFTNKTPCPSTSIQLVTCQTSARAATTYGLSDTHVFIHT